MYCICAGIGELLVLLGVAFLGCARYIMKRTKVLGASTGADSGD